MGATYLLYPSQDIYCNSRLLLCGFESLQSTQHIWPLELTTVLGLLSCFWRVCYQWGLPRLVFTSW